MQTSIYRIEPTPKRPQYWNPISRRMPEMWIFPGVVREFMAAGGRDDTEAGFNRLMYAVIINAIGEGAHGDESAIHWLRKNAPDWLDILGFSMNHTTWQQWIDAGLPGALTHDGRMRWVPEMSGLCVQVDT